MDTLNDMSAHNLTQRARIRQKRIQSFAFVIGVCVAFCLSVGFVALNLTGFGQSYEIKLDGKINPNEAPVASLIRLPGIGLARAGAIVAYRKSFREKEGNSPAFRDCNDLQKVRGIGPKTAQNINAWLRFE